MCAVTQPPREHHHHSSSAAAAPPWKNGCGKPQMAAAAAADTAARVAAALPAGVRLEDVDGLWVLDEAEGSFDTDAADGGRPRVLEGGGGGGGDTMFAGT